MRVPRVVDATRVLLVRADHDDGLVVAAERTASRG
jgi:hypothetical protein